MKLTAVRQLNGDLRIDDEEDDAPMLKLVFCNEWAKLFTDEDKESILEAITGRMGEILHLRPEDPNNRRRDAVLATRKRNEQS